MDSVSRVRFPGRRHGFGTTAVLSAPGRCAASGVGPVVRLKTSSAPLRPPSPLQETFLSLGEARCCHENGFSKGPDPPPKGHRTGKPKWPENRDKKGPLSGGLERESRSQYTPSAPPTPLPVSDWALRVQLSALIHNQPSPRRRVSQRLCAPRSRNLSPAHGLLTPALSAWTGANSSEALQSHSPA